MGKEQQHLDLAELSTLYRNQREYVEELEAGMRDCTTKIEVLEQIINGLFVIAEPGPVKNSLWRRYQGLATPKKAPRKPQEPLEGMSGI
jgi:hypothetical protein